MPCLTTSVESLQSTIHTHITKEYSDFMEVYSKEKTIQLPLHRPWDCAIDPMPNSMPLRSKAYPLSVPKTQAMEDYIKEALATGFICPSMSLATSRLFFVEKKGEGLRLCIDYRGLNVASH